MGGRLFPLACRRTEPLAAGQSSSLPGVGKHMKKRRPTETKPSPKGQQRSTQQTSLFASWRLSGGDEIFEASLFARGEKPVVIREVKR